MTINKENLPFNLEEYAFENSDNPKTYLVDLINNITKNLMTKGVINGLTPSYSNGVLTIAAGAAVLANGMKAIITSAESVTVTVDGVYGLEYDYNRNEIIFRLLKSSSGLPLAKVEGGVLTSLIAAPLAKVATNQEAAHVSSERIKKKVTTKMTEAEITPSVDWSCATINFEDTRYPVIIFEKDTEAIVQNYKIFNRENTLIVTPIDNKWHSIGSTETWDYLGEIVFSK